MLRDYQQDVYRKTVEAFRQGYKRPLVCLPCGGGKSYLFAEMAKNTRGEVLILTHRRELLSQHNELLSGLGVNARVSMVLTEANRLGKHQRPALIIADEAHLSRSSSWMKVLDYYNTFTVGFTATPIRLDGKPLGDMYDTLVEGVTVKWLIENKRLAPFEYYAPMTIDVDSVRHVAGDYVVSDLERIMNEKAIYSNAIDSYKRLANGEKTIAYCVSVKHAESLAEQFRNAGYAAASISAGTPNREQIMDDFRSGNITVLCNVGIISEGISINDVTCCLLLRPTESIALGIQQMMRCMRYAPGKVAKIIDCAGNFMRVGLPDEDREWSLTASAKKPDAMTSEGDFTVRICPKCFKTFKTAPVCPYCGESYQLSPREIKAHEDIELQRITEEELLRIEQEKKRMRMEIGKAKTLADLWSIAKQRNYAPGWVYKMAQVKGIRS